MLGRERRSMARRMDALQRERVFERGVDVRESRLAMPSGPIAFSKAIGSLSQWSVCSPTTASPT
jgi:hypothetical protein